MSRQKTTEQLIENAITRLEIFSRSYEIRNFIIKKDKCKVVFSFDVVKGIYIETIEDMCCETELEKEWEICFNEILEEFESENMINLVTVVNIRTDYARILIETEPTSYFYGYVFYTGAKVHVTVDIDIYYEEKMGIILSEIIDILNAVLKL